MVEKVLRRILAKKILRAFRYFTWEITRRCWRAVCTTTHYSLCSGSCHVGVGVLRGLLLGLGRAKMTLQYDGEGALPAQPACQPPAPPAPPIHTISLPAGHPAVRRARRAPLLSCTLPPPPSPQVQPDRSPPSQCPPPFPPAAPCLRIIGLKSLFLDAAANPAGERLESLGDTRRSAQRYYLIGPFERRMQLSNG